MAERYDATARLADGEPGVGDVEAYVSACRALGYQHPDLTAHAAQVRDWYAGEEGLNLTALDADCAALQSVSRTVDDALTRQERTDQAGAWQGVGGRAARDFLARHQEASVEAVAAVRAAAEALADLRDRLWRAVDDKVATVLAIEDGVRSRRDEWMAAVHTVTTGVGDRAAANELVDQEVKLFVDSVIGDRWLAAMRAAVDAIEAAYDAAATTLASQTGARFEVPGELGPTTAPVASTPSSVAPGVAAPVVQAGSAVPVAPAGWSGPAPAPAVAAAPPQPLPPVAAAPPADAGMTPAMPAPSMPSMPSMGGLPDIGSGLSSFGQQLGDLFGGLLGSGEDGLDPPEVDEPEDLDDLDDPAELEETDESAEDEVTPEEPEEEKTDSAAAAPCPPEPEPAVPVVAPPEDPVAAPEEPVATPVPEPAAPEPLANPVEPLAPEPQSGTPCEIAADELPQVGE